LESIRVRMDRTPGFFRERFREQLLRKNFRKVALTAEIFRNATNKVRNEIPGR